MLKVGEEVGYTGEECVNCGRVRVLHYSKGLDICEKCRWCKQWNRYIYDEEFYDDEEEIDYGLKGENNETNN